MESRNRERPPGILPDGVDEQMMSRLPDSIVMRQGAHGPDGASPGLKGGEAVRQNDPAFGAGSFFGRDQPATAAICLLIR
jgi:hypothetical protein